jgi:hypothetical protein
MTLCANCGKRNARSSTTARSEPIPDGRLVIPAVATESAVAGRLQGRTGSKLLPPDLLFEFKTTGELVWK